MQALNKPWLFATVALLAVVGSLAFILKDEDEFKQYFTEKYQIKSPYIPKTLTFAGETVPLDKFDIKERLDREVLSNVFWRSNSIGIIKRTKKHFEIIEPILKANGIPDDFKYLAVAESGLQNLTSSAGAKGYWQIMKETGLRLGLEINDYVDERYHLQKSTQAACKYLNESYKKFNNWTLTAAAYNRGMSGIERDMDFQNQNQYYDLMLNDETSRYVFRILAFKLIIEKPELYGFVLNENDFYTLPNCKVLNIDTSLDNLADFAIQNGSSYKYLKIFNPWLREHSLPNKIRKPYQIIFPNL